MWQNIVNYFRGVVDETKKVTWPSRQKVINDTLVVIGAIVVATILFGSIDFGLSKIIEIFVINRV